MSRSFTASTSANVTVFALTATGFVSLSARVAALPPSAVTVTVNAVFAGTEVVSSASSYVSTSRAPLTVAVASFGAVVSAEVFATASSVSAATAFSAASRSGFSDGTA